MKPLLEAEVAFNANKAWSVSNKNYQSGSLSLLQEKKEVEYKDWLFPIMVVRSTVSNLSSL
jgi:hypothetical protein